MAESPQPSAWISIILPVVFVLNLVAVGIYGEAEFLFAAIKIVTIIGLLILAVVIDLGGAPSHDRLGFRYWIHPGAMREYIGTGSTGRFLGLFATLINAAYAFGGVEQVAVAAGETKNPSRNIPKAIRRVFWRLAIFYVLTSFAVGLLVPYDNDDLLYGSGVSQSPWLIAMTNAGIPVLPHILNAVLVSSASSSANANLYTGSRYLYALAKQGQAPAFLLKCTNRGVPIFCKSSQGFSSLPTWPVLSPPVPNPGVYISPHDTNLQTFLGVMITGSFGLLAYMTASSKAADVFHWLTSLVTISYLMTWTCLCFAFTRFRRALAIANIDRTTLPFKSPFQPYLAWIGVCFFSIVLVFNGFTVFTHGNWNTQTFVSSYIGIP